MIWELVGPKESLLHSRAPTLFSSARGGNTMRLINLGTKVLQYAWRSPHRAFPKIRWTFKAHRPKRFQPLSPPLQLLCPTSAHTEWPWVFFSLDKDNLNSRRLKWMQYVVYGHFCVKPSLCIWHVCLCRRVHLWVCLRVSAHTLTWRLEDNRRCWPWPMTLFEIGSCCCCCWPLLCTPGWLAHEFPEILLSPCPTLS